ncbi:Ig-like domain-containing protein [Vibrio proteolyticus]|uniref:chitinase n=1 Tax=Vibrio proteolyticus NBRC 13287 TaxID=1219065 RepID=U3A3J1_VIBPR|nr:Ig-like domain-containing protein [Vibrio proteolyticus]GAD67897.1 putative chitinase [Vibrio proteolyticus NBRC 13287]
MRSPLLRTAILTAIGLSAPALAYQCDPLAEWDSQSTYTSGDEVQRAAQAFRANYWTAGDDPLAHSGDWQEWQALGPCDQSDNQAPQVSLISPVNNAQIPQGSTITLKASAEDSDGSISHVDFQIDGQTVATVTQAPYQTSWTATLGAQQVTIVATDNQGATTTQSTTIQVTPSGDLIPPTISLTSPSGSESVNEGSSLTLSAEASDSDGSIIDVTFLIDGAPVATVTSSPYQYHWAAQAGEHTFSARVTDNDQQSTSSKSVNLTIAGAGNGGCAGLPLYSAGTSYSAGELVQNSNQKYRCDIAGWCSSSSAWAYEPGKGEYWQEAWSAQGACSAPPSVTLTSPAQGQVFLAGSNVTLNADASDSDGSISKVEFFANSQSLGSLAQPPYRTGWSATTLGSNTLKAVATDNEGNRAESSVTVTVSDQDLVVALTSPASGQNLALGKATTLSADATSLTGSIRQVDFVVNGAVVGTDTSAPYQYSWTPGAVGDYTIAAEAIDNSGQHSLSDAASVKVVTQVEKKHKLIGYWHNFVNGAGCPMPLADMSDAWDVIDIAFAENDRNSTGTVHFNLYSGDIHSSCPALNPAQFKQQMAALQAKGKKFVLSLGGAEGTITLNTDEDEAHFVSSLTQIIQEWGFDGLDVDLESGSNLVHGSQIQARLGRALLQIEQNIGGDMYLTMAPEHPYVQGGFVAYSGIWGAYIPVIDQVRDTLDLLHVQLYNNGGLPNPYMAGSVPEGSVDMMVAQSKMLIEGFELADGSFFAPLRDDQVAIGLPSGPSSANSGQAPTQNILDALDCLTKGTQCDTLTPAFNYPNYAGVMTWSINWDHHDGYNFSGPVGDKLTQMNNAQ